jgi:hypothetical protein
LWRRGRLGLGGSVAVQGLYVDHFLLIILEHDLALAALLQFRRLLLWIQFELGLFLKGHIYY